MNTRERFLEAKMKKSYLLLIELTVLAFAFAQMASAATTYYVTTNGTGNLSGTDWANATNSLQGAIDAIDTGAANTVWVSNGVYEVGGVTNYPTGTVLTNRVAIYKAITVRSANNDPTNTIIRGAWDPATNGPAAVRCMYMTNGSTLIGFMLTNGATLTTGADDDTFGGGVFCQSTNTVISNCVMTGNAAEAYGGGARYGTLYNCTITGNRVVSMGGGASGSTMYNCILTVNYSGYAAGGAHSCILNNCNLIGNSAVTFGGGGRGGTMYNCTLTSNSTLNASSGGGGGTYQGDLYNCQLSGNSTPHYGAGAYVSTLHNCMIVSNTGWVGGGAYNSILYNCTLVSNSAFICGGVVEGTLYNCISWDNNNVDSEYTAYYSCGVGYTNGGSVSGNITNNPLFVDSGAGNYHLSKDSPCVNTGTNSSWMTDPADVGSKDLDGHSRIDRISGLVDMGAYEFIHKITLFLGY